MRTANDVLNAIGRQMVASAGVMLLGLSGCSYDNPNEQAARERQTWLFRCATSTRLFTDEDVGCWPRKVLLRQDGVLTCSVQDESVGEAPDDCSCLLVRVREPKPVSRYSGREIEVPHTRTIRLTDEEMRRFCVLLDEFTATASAVGGFGLTTGMPPTTVCVYYREPDGELRTQYIPNCYVCDENSGAEQFLGPGLDQTIQKLRAVVRYAVEVVEKHEEIAGTNTFVTR